MKDSPREKLIITINKLPKWAVITIGFLVIVLAAVIEVLINNISSSFVGPLVFVIIAVIGCCIIMSPGSYKTIMDKKKSAAKTAASKTTDKPENNTQNTVKKITKRTNKQYKKKKKRR